MIWESCYWKEPLLEVAVKLSRWPRVKHWTEERLVQIEKDVFVSFYAIRKLLDSNKLSDTTRILQTNLYSYKSLGKPVTLMNWHDVDELYNLSNRNCEKLKLRYLCNQIIHSYVFVPSHNDYGGMGSFLFCSDRMRNEKIYEIEIEEMKRILRIVGKDYPSSASYKYNPTKKDYEISSF